MFIISIIGLCFSIIGFLLCNRKNILCWPIWMISGSIFAYVYFQNDLVVGVLRELIYIILGFEGYYRWGYKNGQRK